MRNETTSPLPKFLTCGLPCGCSLDFNQVRVCAEFFISHPKAEGLFLWEDGKAHLDPRPGSDLAFYVTRMASLRYSIRGDWRGEVEFMDKLEHEDAAWEAIWG